MEATEVLAVLDVLRGAGVRAWLDGGWGVDALLGEQTRDHGDVDLVVELDRLDAVVAALAPLGYALEEDHLPTRAVLSGPPDRRVDLHPVTFDDRGTGWQRGASSDGSDCPYPAEGFEVGTVMGRPVPCLSPSLQVEHHRGYPKRDRDRDDLRRLAERFGVPPQP